MDQSESQKSAPKQGAKFEGVVSDYHGESAIVSSGRSPIPISDPDASMISSTISRPLADLARLHRERDPDLRLIQSWTNRPSRRQSWGLEDGAARLVLSVIHRFLQTPPLRLHGVLGDRGKAPSFDTIVTGNGTTDVPREATYFIEDESTGERFVLTAEDLMRDTQLSFDATDPSARIDSLRAFASEQNYLRGQVFDLRGQILDFSSIDLEDVILTPQQRMLIERHVLGFTQRFSELRERRAKLTRGVLLEGPPGCGKSMLLRALADRMGEFSVCLASPSQLCKSGAIDILDTMVRMTAPCAVIMEEVDLFAGPRHRFVNPGLAELMQLMDGLRTVPGVLWIGTTNRPAEVEQALADRPGRFDRRIKFGPLDEEPRATLIDRLIMPQTLSAEGRLCMLSMTEGWTGAQIRELCETLRLISDADQFTEADIAEAADDCGFEVGGTFGFGARPGRGVNQ